jgi:hypothetical protein
MEKENHLSKNIQELTKQIESSNSPWKNFGRGVIFGIGSAIGASIIAAIIIGTVAKIIHSMPYIPGVLR